MLQIWIWLDVYVAAIYLGLNMESESQILSYLMNSKERRYAHHVHSILSF